ncbi:MAG: hypothetical protein KAX28_06215 [Candidatus Marinimicrobia bacterium]|nr:hypothetical protein [Candidatus Neomarinimicrobiota bacterium]
MVVGLTLSCRRLAQDFGNPPEIQWIKSYSGCINFIKQCPDGDYFLVGSKGYPGKGYDIFIIKTGKEGDSLKARNYGGWESEHLKSIGIASDGSLILAGCSIGNREYSGFYIKADSLGDSLFGDKYECSIDAILQADNGENILVSKKENSILFSRINAKGDTLWSKSNETITDKFSIRQISDSLIIVVYDGDEGEIPSKIEFDGMVIWKKYLPGMIQFTWVNSAAETMDGGFFLVGTSTQYPTRLYLMKTDNSLNISWDKTYDIAGSGVGYSICKISKDEYVILGTGESFGMWNFDTPYWFERIIIPIGEKYSTISKFLELIGIGVYSNLLIYKINSDGEILWRKKIMTKKTWDIHSFSSAMVYCTLTPPRFWENFTLEVTSDNSIIVGGFFDGAEGTKTSYLIKLKPEK